MDIKDIIDQGESWFVEFKESYKQSIVASIVAFANAEWWSIFIWIRDNWEIVWTTLWKETIPEIINQIKNCTDPKLLPDVREHYIGDKVILEIIQAQFPFRPVQFKWKYYIRKWASNHVMSLQEINDLYLHDHNLSWDSYAYKDWKISDIDYDKVWIYSTMLWISNVDMYFQKMRLLVDWRPTYAVMLLFAKHPLPYRIHIARLKWNWSTILDDVQIETTLFEAIEETMMLIKKHINVRYEFDGSTSRKEVRDYPLEALREAIINAVVHRDYRDGNDIQIKIFDDKISIFNPGKVYGDLSVQQILTGSYSSSLRNKLLAEVFYRHEKIEKLGTGFARIQEYIDNGYMNSVTYDFFEWSGGCFSVFTLENALEKAPENALENAPEKLTLNQTKIIQLMHQNRKITYKEMEKIVWIDISNIKRNIQKLKEMKLIERHWSDRSGYRIVIDERNLRI